MAVVAVVAGLVGFGASRPTPSVIVIELFGFSCFTVFSFDGSDTGGGGGLIGASAWVGSASSKRASIASIR